MTVVHLVHRFFPPFSISVLWYTTCFCYYHYCRCCFLIKVRAGDIKSIWRDTVLREEKIFFSVCLCVLWLIITSPFFCSSFFFTKKCLMNTSRLRTWFCVFSSYDVNFGIYNFLFLDSNRLYPEDKFPLWRNELKCWKQIDHNYHARLLNILHSLSLNKNGHCIIYDALFFNTLLHNLQGTVFLFLK